MRYLSEPAEPEPRVAPMMPEGENSHNVFVDETEQDGVGEPANETAPNVALHHGELARIRENPVNGRIHFGPQLIA
jgi:hypothetical protein